MPPTLYKTPSAFKDALEARLRGRVGSGDTRSMNRRRMLLIFDRLLARVVHEFTDTVVLKGGLALELRLKRARTTKDIDLRMTGDAATLLPRLQRAGRANLGDYMTFEILVAPDHSGIEDTIYEGFRFKSTCLLAGKLYGAPFGIDVAFGDPMIAPPDEIVAPDLLDFIDVEPPRVRVYPPETHLAEKLHAYTLPRIRQNSRVKDLPDMALLGQLRPYQASRLRAAFASTFEFRQTHPVPTSVQAPPDDWLETYARIARTEDLPWATLAQLTDSVRRFLDPVLASDAPFVWSPGDWKWDPA